MGQGQAGIRITPHPCIVRTTAGDGLSHGTGLVFELGFSAAAKTPQTGNAAHAQAARLMARTTIEEPAG